MAKHKRELTTTIASRDNGPNGVQLKVSDRCDRCGAQAFVATRHGDAGVLLWCAHDYTDRIVALEPHLVTDIRDRLFEKETASV